MYNRNIMSQVSKYVRVSDICQTFESFTVKLDGASGRIKKADNITE